MAALYCPGELDLTRVERLDRIEELELILRDQSRETLLRTAELAGERALEMRVVIDGATGGDTAKMRALLRKIELAWPVSGHESSARARKVLDSLKDFFRDIDLTEEDVGAAVTAAP
jgi:hypothetical protein